MRAVRIRALTLLVWLLAMSCASQALALTATIHYQRADDDYAGWGLHVWGAGLAPGQATAWAIPRAYSGSDGYGSFWSIEVDDASLPVGFIVHKGDAKLAGHRRRACQCTA